MSQLHAYKSYIEYLVDQAKKQQLDNLAHGILQTHFMVNELQAENEKLKAENKELQEILHFGNQDRTMIAMIGKAKENKKQALENKQ